MNFVNSSLKHGSLGCKQTVGYRQQVGNGYQDQFIHTLKQSTLKSVLRFFLSKRHVTGHIYMTYSEIRGEATMRCSGIRGRFSPVYLVKSTNWILTLMIVLSTINLFCLLAHD